MTAPTYASPNSAQAPDWARAEVQRALEIGVERYLGKPYQEDDLLRQVQEVLRRERV